MPRASPAWGRVETGVHTRVRPSFSHWDAPASKMGQGRVWLDVREGQADRVDLLSLLQVVALVQGGVGTLFQGWERVWLCITSWQPVQGLPGLGIISRVLSHPSPQPQVALPC